MVKRYAIVQTRTPAQVAAYMPANYEVMATFEPGELDDLVATRTDPGCIPGYGYVVIEGRDSHGWTLDDYVIPRLQSGLHAAWEIDLSHPVMKRIPMNSGDQADWQYEVRNGDTRLGYDEWREHRAEAMRSDPPTLWERDDLQFPRLLAELMANVEFTDDMLRSVAESMDLELDEVLELFNRAQEAWEGIKSQTT